MTNAEDPRSLLLLALGSDGNRENQRMAEMRLSSLESTPGFCLAMAQVADARDTEDRDVRWLASTCLKNSVSKHWRSIKADQGPTPNEKEKLRAWLLRAYFEEDGQIAAQITMAMSKVARADFPREWKELFPTLICGIRAEEGRTNLKSYRALHRVLKELSTKRLASDQRNFEAVASEIFEEVWSRWKADTGSILAWIPHGLQSLQGPECADPGLMVCVDRWRLCIKCIRRIVIFGYESDARALKLVPAVRTVVQAFMETLKALLQHWDGMQGDCNPALRWLRRGTLKLFKSQEEFQQIHPWSYMEGGVAVQVLEFCHSIITAKEVIDAKLLYEPLIIESMILMQSMLMCSIYKGNYTVLGMHERFPEKEALMEHLSSMAKASLDSFMTRERTVGLAKVLINHYLPITSEELEAWNDDPESFQNEQNLIQYKERVRPTAESLFVYLLGADEDVLAPLTIQWLHSAIADFPLLPKEAADPGLSHALLHKEAMYNAIALGCHHLHNSFAFGDWLCTCVLPDMVDEHPSLRILRRRCATILGAWVPEIPDDARPGCYHALLSLLSSGDMCLQIAAVTSMKALIDDWNFHESQFLEYCWPVLRLLFLMSSRSSEFDTQMQVFSLVSLIVERLGEKIEPYATSILETIPDVWESSKEHTMLRMQVVVVLQKLVTALDTRSPGAYRIVLPILQYSTSPYHSESTALLEDGLLLWRTILKYALFLPPELMGMFPNLMAVMEVSFEHIQMAVQILEAYVLVGGSPFFESYGTQTCSFFAGIFGEVKEKGMLLTLPAMDTCLCCLPNRAAQILEPALQKLLHVTMFGNESDLVVGASCGIFGRILLQDQSLFLQFMERAFAAGVGSTVPTMKDAKTFLLAFVDLWLDKFDSVTTEQRRKLACLSFCRLLDLKQPEMLSRLELILVSCTSVIQEYESEVELPCAIGEWKNSTETSCSFDVSSTGPSTGEVQRRISLYESDPVQNLSLKMTLARQLHDCERTYGELYAQQIQKVDPSVWSQFIHSISSISNGSRESK